MKFMKLGSKADAFQTDGDNNIRYVASELSSDLIVNVVDVKFCLHKFPLLSKSARLQKLVAVANADGKDEIYIQDFPGGPTAFETCAKFCYGMTVTLNAYNVVGARCAADYLEMYETVEKGNLVYKIDVFLSSSIFRGWKDSIIVLQTTKPLLQGAEELKLVSHCIDAVASKASVDISQVEWSYTYNRKKLSSENEQDQQWKLVPNDWWVEDLCDLDVDLYKRVISAIKAKGRVCGDVIGEALKAYAMRRLPGFSKGTIKGGDPMKNQLLVETIARLLPRQKGTVACSFLLRLLRAALLVECGEIVRKELMIRIGWQLDEASAADLLIRAPSEAGTVYDVDMVQDLVKLFVTQEQGDDDSILVENPYTISDASKGMVAKLVDCYLAEISRDPNLQLSSFMSLAELVSPFPRPSHDGLYRAIDTFLKDHPGISKSERKRICKLMDCRKLSVEACTHAVQNERLPLRMVVQVLFFEQVRASTSASNGNSEVPGGQIRALLPVGSHGSSRSAATTNTEEDWDGVPTTEELKALKGELANLRLGGGEGKRSTNNRNGNVGTKNEAEKVAANKVKGLLMSKRLFSKLWSNKDKDGDNSSSDTSESPASTNGEEIESTPSRSRRRPLS